MSEQHPDPAQEAEDAACEMYDALAHIEAAAAKLGVVETYVTVKDEPAVRSMIDRLDELLVEARAFYQRLEEDL